MNTPTAAITGAEPAFQPFETDGQNVSQLIEGRQYRDGTIEKDYVETSFSALVSEGTVPFGEFIVTGAEAALMLSYSGVLRESLIKSAPIYGLTGSAVTIFWALLGGQDMHGFRFDILGFRVLFAQSDFFFSS